MSSQRAIPRCAGLAMIVGLGLALGCTPIASASGSGELSVAARYPAPDPPEPPFPPVITDEVLPEQEHEIAVSAGVDFVTKYIARGIVFSNNKSVQPWLELQVPLLDLSGTRERGPIRWRIGTWNSIQFTDAIGVDRSRTRFQRRFSGWYETDLYTGFIVPLGERTTMTFSYFYYNSPANGFGDIHELELRLSYDDSHWWEDALEGFTLNPALRITRELYNADGMTRWYFQPSITPSYTFDELPLPLTVQVPVVLGFSPKGWYRDAAGDDLFFGYVMTGVRGSVPLRLFGDDVSPLTLTAGIDVLIVNDRTIHGFDKRADIVGRVGLSYSF